MKEALTMTELKLLLADTVIDMRIAQIERDRLQQVVEELSEGLEGEGATVTEIPDEGGTEQGGPPSAPGALAED